VFLASLGAGLFAAGASALHVARSTGEGLLGTSRRLAGTTVSQRRALWAFQAMQIAMTLVVLMGAGLMANSLARMAWTDPGFPIDSLAYFDVGLASSHYPLRSQQDHLYETVLTRVRSLPGVRGATIGNPPTGGQGGTFIAEGQPVGSNRGDLAIHYVRPEYFSVVGIPLRAGRLLGSADTEDSGVGLVDEVTARRRFGGGNAIGQRFRYSSDGPWITVVGVVGKVKTRHFTDTNNGEIYLPAVEHAPAPDRTLVVRVDGDTSAGLKAVRSAISAMDPNIKVSQMGAVADYYADVFGPPRFSLLLMAVFAVLATLTAAVGLYGVLSCAVSQRTREIGIRIALGAGTLKVRRMVLADTLAPVSIGIAAGVGVWLLLGRVVTIELYQITPHDESTFAIVILCLLALGACAAFFPVRRATRVDPAVALRAD
jgi:predicted permease